MKKKFNIVICSLNSQYIHSALAPWCILAGINAYCEHKGCACVVEGTVNEPVQNVVKRITDKNPHLIGLSCYIWNIKQTLELADLIKKECPQAIIVLGGPEVSYNPAQILLENETVDYVIAGEGEKPFARLVDAVIANNGHIKEISGLCCREDGKILANPPYVCKDEPPSPYSTAYFQSLNGRIAYLETSRGCPFSCAFCLSGRCGNVRYFDADRAKEKILLLANSGARTVKLVDRTFNANRKRAFALFEFIINNYASKIPSGICFHFEIAGDILDEATLSLLRSAPDGTIQLEIGLQSFNPKTLESINRKTDTAQLERNITRLVQMGNIHIHIDLIAGLPFEDLDSFAHSFNTAYSLRPHMLQLGFLKLLHGSEMRENTEKYPCEYAPTAPYEVISTPWLSKSDLRKLHIIESALDRIYNSGRFGRTLEYVLAQSGYTPFELFHHFGEFAKGLRTRDLPLDLLTERLYNCFKAISGVDQTRLRDTMVCDRLATNASGILPKILQIKDEKLKGIRLMLDENPETRRPKGIKRGVALLYSENCAVYADYQNKNPVTGAYMLQKIEL